LSSELDGRLEVTIRRVGVLERGPAGKRATIVRLVEPPGSGPAPSRQATEPSRKPV
jgi:hypothetical protein